jgi:hypothetical protein
MSQADDVARFLESIDQPVPVEGALNHDLQVLLERLDQLQDP